MRYPLARALEFGGILALLHEATGWAPIPAAVKDILLVLLTAAVWIPMHWWRIPVDPKHEALIQTAERRAIVTELDSEAGSIARSGTWDAARIARAYRTAALFVRGGPHHITKKGPR